MRGGGDGSSRHAKLAVVLTTTLLSLVLAELGLRTFSPKLAKLRSLVQMTDDERGFAPKASTRIVFDGLFEPLRRSIVWETNSAGFRDDHDVGRPDGRFRIATYGDSETFGWSVTLEETFQRRMEAIDPRVEVLNFGVPGYQVINVREQLEHTVPLFQPDLAIYLVHKNDFNEPPQLTPWSQSHLLLHIHFLWHFTIGKKIRVATRSEPDHLEMFADEVDRMTRFLETRDIPFLLGFMRWKNHKVVRAFVPSDSSGMFQRRLLDVQAVLDDERKLDDHYTAPAHVKMATFFCQAISGVASGSCIPPGWRRETPHAPAAGPRTVRGAHDSSDGRS